MIGPKGANRRLVGRLTAAGAMPSQWRDAFLAVPRHVFVPDVIWDGPGRALRARRRADDPAAWLETVYADQPIVTQVDDGATPATGTGQRVTSSISKPSIVARILDRLRAEPGMRVLEIGTGTGWNAALLAHRVGEHNVTTIEVDAALAARARTALTEAGLAPTVVTGDGARGYARNAPYDRVIATASVRRVPQLWVAQTRPGGLIVTPWGTSYDNGALACLTVNADGTASGHFADNTVAFMWLREHRAAPLALPSDLDGAAESTTTLHPDAVAWSDYDATFAIGLHLPDVATTFVDGEADDFTFWATAGPSWARVDVVADGPPHRVRQYGPRHLWDEIRAAHDWWQAMGRPATDRFGLTVGPQGQQAWLDTPKYRSTVPAVLGGADGPFRT